MSTRLRNAHRFGVVVLVGVAIVAASTLSVEPKLKTKVLRGKEARAFVAARNLPLIGGEDRAATKRQSEEVMRAKGWQPAGESHVSVRRHVRDITFARRMVEWLVPALHADFYGGSGYGGYIYAESWNDGDNATWEGYSEICVDGYACTGGTSQVHTGSGGIAFSWGNPFYTDGFQSWATCAYSGCLGMTWGCFFSGPGYWTCLGGSCVGAAAVCGFSSVLQGCGEKGPSECNPAQ